MIARSHYDRDTLTRFLDDEAGDAAEMSSHIESCEGCRSTLESLVSEGLTIELAGELLRSSGDIECAGDRIVQADREEQAGAFDLGHILDGHGGRIVVGYGA